MGETLNVVGKPLMKVDALAKVSGETRFADDLELPRVLYARLRRSDHPHALLRSVDISAARALPGVVAVITGDALPIPFGILPVSQDEHALARGKVRYVGDPIAAVAAIDEETAEKASELIRVEYEPLPSIMSIQDALQKPGVRIHDYGDGGNVHKFVSLEFGAVDEGFARADHVREDTIYFEGNTHLPLEQMSAMAHATADGKLTLWSSPRRRTTCTAPWPRCWRCRPATSV
jgi:CO/xanthine dehydrogenase Mo-binding subunit